MTEMLSCQASNWSRARIRAVVNWLKGSLWPALMIWDRRSMH